MNPLWLLRMKRWVQHPPPMWRVYLVAGAIMCCLGILAIETWIGWPDWMTVEPTRRIPKF